MSFEDNTHRTSHKRYFLPAVEIKNYNVLTDGKNFFDQPVIIDIRTYDNIRKIATVQENNYTTGCLLGYVYLKNYYKMIAIDLSKRQEKPINFIVDLDSDSL